MQGAGRPKRCRPCRNAQAVDKAAGRSIRRGVGWLACTCQRIAALQSVQRQAEAVVSSVQSREGKAPETKSPAVRGLSWCQPLSMLRMQGLVFFI